MKARLLRAQILFKQSRYALEITLFGKMLAKEWEKTMSRSQTSTQGRARRWLDDFTPVIVYPDRNQRHSNAKVTQTH